MEGNKVGSAFLYWQNMFTFKMYLLRSMAFFYCMLMLFTLNCIATIKNTDPPNHVPEMEELKSIND